jgi:uncharacterized membrane protein YecN with MAPEG domain
MIYAAILGLLGAGLTVNVIVNRARFGVDAGDGGKPSLAQAIRAHGNFAEQVPLALLLIASVELLGYHAWAIHLLGAALLVARLLSAWGLSRSLAASNPRQMGAGLTGLVTVAASVLILYGIFANH